MRLRDIWYPIYFKHIQLKGLRKKQAQTLERIREKGYATVAFIVSTLPMWRNQALYDLLAADSRFRPIIAIYPFASFATDEQNQIMQELREHFSSLGVPFIDLSKEPDPVRCFRKEINPDIIFYPQPYYILYDNGLDSHWYEDRLLCYVPYGLNTMGVRWPFNQRFSNVGWRLFYSTEIDRKSAERFSFCKGENARAVGNPTADYFLHSNHPSPWKTQGTSKKRIIWAPHFSIAEGGLLYRNSFLSLHQDMLDLARKYRHCAQFAFKPHPRLKSVLYDHPDWGEKRTDNYYSLWANGENTQLETGAYIDLFMNSDAMIHDCVSFSAEYHYTHNPVLFTTSDLQSVSAPLSVLGRAALEAHYIGENIRDVESFIIHVVIGGEDPLKENRNVFFNDFLLPPNGKSTAENIYQEMLDSLNLSE